MRFVLRDEARSRSRHRRGGDLERVSMAEAPGEPASFDAEILALDQAFDHLADQDPRLAKVVEYRFYAGLTVKETAELMGLSPMTVKRDWAKASAILSMMMEGQ